MFNTIYEALLNWNLNEDLQAESPAQDIDLSKCRSIASDKIDSRNEVEASSCLYYTPKGSDEAILTRVAAYVFVVKETDEGFFFLSKKRKHRLPGGGYDVNKDHQDLKNTVARETLEEVGIKIKDIKDANYSIWRPEQDNGFEAGWVRKHIAREEDRHHGYYEKYYLARYDEVEENDGEEYSIFEWTPISAAEKSSSINRIMYDRALEAGYLIPTIEEDMQLDEGKQVGLVSYCVHRGTDSTPSAVILDKIVKTNFIAASPADKSTWPNAPYVSLSRDLASHIGKVWKNGIILDGDKLSDKYKIKPIDHNTQIYFTKGRSDKNLQLTHIAKYENINNPNDHFYTAKILGDSFNIDLDEQTYNALKALMFAFNADVAPKKQVTYGELNKFSDKPDAYYDNEKQRYRKPHSATIPDKYRNKEWKCVEAYGYDVQHPKLYLKYTFLDKYKDVLLANGIDISDPNFLLQVSGKGYAHEAEERAVARIKKFVRDNGKEENVEELSGLDISGCIKGVMVNIMYKYIIEHNFESPYYFYDLQTNSPIHSIEQDAATIKALQDIVNYCQSNNIPMIYVYEGISNAEVSKQL